ncbi:hypothetical protein CRM22_001052 [Opisthorchis felineus]|uniref:Uncharacterized protein n=1 Tax=Opisthorchis felineus TaxID=147828 RepID=A0A4V3SGZ7_OPIFE|nr:hypothetical protein CRM22_001052 [Opisthorchis felineus]
MELLIYNKDVFLDPTYPDLNEFMVDYDYDLVGTPLGWWRKITDTHLYTMRSFFEDNAWLISFCFLGLVLLLVILVAIAGLIAKIPSYFINRWFTMKELKRENIIADERRKFMQRDDPDRFAAVYCRSATNKLGVASVHNPVPQDLPDFEAVRFVFTDPRLIEKTHQALKKQKIDPTLDQLVDGELEDALLLALSQKRLEKRKPLSLPARIVAKQMLARGEMKIPTGPIITPEMKLIQGWEQLYRRQLKEATEENYRWWLAQDRTLPVESREVTEKLQPLVRPNRSREKASSKDDESARGKSRGTRSPSKKMKSQSEPRKRPTEQGPPALHTSAHSMDRQKDPDDSSILREIERIEGHHSEKETRAHRRKSSVSSHKKKDRSTRGHD